jgi:hypothetical protein
MMAAKPAAAGAAASGLNRIARRTLNAPLPMSSAATRIPAVTPDVRRTFAAPRLPPRSGGGRGADAAREKQRERHRPDEVAEEDDEGHIGPLRPGPRHTFNANPQEVLGSATKPREGAAACFKYQTHFARERRTASTVGQS